MTSRARTTPVTLTFLTCGGLLLLQRRPLGSDRFAGLWNGVGGHVEPGEHAREGALREIREETGLAPKDLELRAVIHETGLLGRSHLLFVFTGEADSSEHVPKSPAGECRWYERGALPLDSLVPDLPVLLPAVLDPSAGVAFGVQHFDGGDRALALRID
ncbi:MAG: NUDIX domain-containing protein [Deltaproteobacteria bacterium]|nr:NUDIX domain-containing protein [Deltaproteobacteria bacterium]